MLGSEFLHFVEALAPDADRFNGDPDTDILSLENYEGVTFVIILGTGTTGTVKFVATASDDAAGSTTEAIAARYRVQSSSDDTFGAITTLATTGYTTTAGGDQIILIEVLASDLPDGKPWVYIDTTEVVDDPIDAGILAVLHHPHHVQKTQLTAIA